MEDAKMHGKRKVARKFYAGENSIREWRKQKGLLKVRGYAKRSVKSEKAHWLKLENDLKK
ncbi:hypothetical protein HZS_1008 [Henneguya salminicola]|nr:hypothetical protein HZS_1008 [Henneguya salminicola]